METEMNKQEKLRARFEAYYSRRDLTRKETDPTKYASENTQNKWMGFRACAFEFDII